MLLYLFTIELLHNLTSLAELLAVTSAPTEFLNKFYREQRNDDPPNEWDRALVNASVRQHICEDIGNSGAFTRYETVNTREESPDMEIVRERHTAVFNRIFERKSISHSYEYSNPYAAQRFQIGSVDLQEDRGYTLSFFGTVEHVFACLLKRNSFGETKFFIFYVSKAYNRIYDRRFVFMGQQIMLAETPSRVYARPDFNVELHYLELRKHYHPASRIEDDPLCKLNTEGFEDDQSFRLCVLVLKSSHFEGKILYPRRSLSNVCSFHKIAFSTDEAEEAKLPGKSYQERMIRCAAQGIDQKSYTDFYISRGYQHGQVLIYVRGPADKFYLEHLCTHVSIMHERYNFGNVEI